MDMEHTEVTLEQVEELAFRLPEKDRLTLARRLKGKKRKVVAAAAGEDVWERILEDASKIGASGYSISTEEIVRLIREDRDER